MKKKLNNHMENNVKNDLEIKKEKMLKEREMLKDALNRIKEQKRNRLKKRDF